MIIDMRVYRYAPSQFPAFLRAYDDVGFAITSRHLGVTVGVLTSHSGLQNRTLQLFAYRDADHRDACRQALRVDPEWLAFIREASPAIVEQHNTILRPVAGSVLHGFAQLDDRTWLGGDGPGGTVFELTSYTARPGQLPALLAILSDGCAILGAFAERPVSCFRADTGAANRVLVLQAYGNDGERHRRRERMEVDPGFQQLRERIEPLLMAEDTELWLPRPYSPLR